VRGRRASHLGRLHRPDAGRVCCLAHREPTNGHISAWVPLVYDNRLSGGSGFVGGHPSSGDGSEVHDGLAAIVACVGRASIDGTTRCRGC
jgi:hypothetical protein